MIFSRRQPSGRPDGFRLTPYAEQRWGKLYDCKFVGVVEKDSRHGAADFVKEKQRAPADLKGLLDKVEFIEYRRRDFEEKAMVQELARRISQ